VTMSLPARVLAPTTRAIGMGVFFTLFYGFVVAAPLVAGVRIEWTGWDGAARTLSPTDTDEHQVLTEAACPATPKECFCERWCRGAMRSVQE